MKRYLKLIAIVSCLLILLSFAVLAADKYVSSKYSVYYHQQSCKKARKIDPLIKVLYNSPREALEAGKRPCETCKPPAKDYWGENKPQGN